MNGAADRELSGHSEFDIESTAWILVARIKAEGVGFQIGVMQQVAVIIDELDGIAALDRDFAGRKCPALL